MTVEPQRWQRLEKLFEAVLMQYVGGEPITDSCDRRRLSIEARLELFARVCRAVQFSHANLVVHRQALDGFDGAIRRIGNARGAGHIQTAVLIAHQAQILARLDRPVEAVEAAARAVEIVCRAAPEPGHRLAQTLLHQGRVLLAAGSASAAEAAFREALQIDLEDPEDPFRPALTAGLGLALVALGRGAEARPLLVEAEPVLTDWPMADPVTLAQLHAALKQLDEGESGER